MTAKDFMLKLPTQVDASALQGVNTLFHFDITGAGGGQFPVLVENGNVSVSEIFIGDPKCKVSTSEQTMLGLLDGSVNPMMAVLTGKLVISNQAELMKYARHFGLM